MKKRVLAILLLFIVTLPFTIKYLNRYFGKTQSLSYIYDESLEELMIYKKEKNMESSRKIYIKGKDKINEFFSYLNKIELVEEKKELNTVDNDYISIAFYNRFDNKTIIYDNISCITIIDNNIFFVDIEGDWIYSSYYIKDNIKRKEFFNYLNDLLN